jgi:hypothetical protein
MEPASSWSMADSARRTALKFGSFPKEQRRRSPRLQYSPVMCDPPRHLDHADVIEDKRFAQGGIQETRQVLVSFFFLHEV